MRTAEEIREKAEKEIAALEVEQKIRSEMPEYQPEFVHWHASPCDGHAVLKIKGKTIAEALAIYDATLDRMPMEGWKDGALSVAPLGANFTAQRGKGPTENGATHDFVAEFALTVDSYGSRGEYQRAEFEFWRLSPSGILCQLQIELSDGWRFQPERHVTYRRSGEVSHFSVTPKNLGEKRRIKWWSEAPSYRVSYYFDFPTASLTEDLG